MPQKVDRPQTTHFISHWVIFCTALALVAGALVADGYKEHRKTAALQMERLANQAEILAANIDHQLEAIHTAMVGIRQDLPVRRNTDDWDRTNRWLKTFASAMVGVRTIYISDAEGRVLACNHQTLMGRDFSWRDYFETVKGNPSASTVHLSPPFRSALGVFIINMVMMVPGPEGQFDGIIAVSLDPVFFSTLFSAVRYAPDMWVALAHADGKLFLMSPANEKALGKNLAVPGSIFSRHIQSGKAATVTRGTVYATGEYGIVAMHIIKPPSLPLDDFLAVGVGRNYDAIFAGWRKEMWIRALLMACMALLSGVALAAYQRGRARLLRQDLAAQEALRDSESWMRLIFHSLDVAVFVTTADDDRKIIRCNEAAEAMHGYSAEEMRQNPTAILHVDESHFEEYGRRIGQSAEQGGRDRFEFQMRRRNGEVFPTEHTVGLLRNERGEALGILSVVRDITERRQLEAQRQLSKTVFENSAEGMVVADSSGVVRMVNPSCTEITGYEADEIIGRDMDVFRSDGDDPKLAEKIWQGLTEEGRWSGEYWNRRKSGEAYPEWLNLSIVRNNDGSIANIIAIFYDITDLKRKQERIRFQAQHDALTGLPNRALFEDRLSRSIARAERQGTQLALVFMDLDHFKSVNDTMGHHTGDILLRQTAERIQACLRKSDTVSRMGGDEFTMILPEIQGVEEALEVLRRVTEAMRRPFDLEGKAVSVTISMGVAFYPAHGLEAEVLLKRADKAMYQAKAAGRDNMKVYGADA